MNKKRLYEIRVQNLKTGKDYPSGFSLVDHETACILLRKMMDTPDRRNYLVER